MTDPSPTATPTRPAWTPVRHSVFRDAALAERIHDQGLGLRCPMHRGSVPEPQA